MTVHLPLIGAAPGRSLSEPPGEHLYGSEAALLRSLPGADHWLWRDAESGKGGLSEAMVRFALRYEMARGIEDVLARRSRLLFLDAARAAELIEPVAALIEDELGRRVGADERQAFAAPGAALPEPALMARRIPSLKDDRGLARIIPRLC